jgi:hypothetical protein
MSVSGYKAGYGDGYTPYQYYPQQTHHYSHEQYASHGEEVSPPAAQTVPRARAGAPAPRPAGATPAL